MNAGSRDVDSVMLPIEGLNCASCVGRVERALTSVPGVSEASVNLAASGASVRFEAPTTRAALVRAIEGVGYDVPVQTIDLSVEGMSCASCVGRVERALKEAGGVMEASVNLATQRATVKGSAEAFALIETLSAAGYTAREITEAYAQNEILSRRHDDEARRLKRSVLLAGALTVPVFVLEMGSHMNPACST